MNRSEKYARLEWKPIPGLSGYEACEDGRIRRGHNPLAIRRTDAGVPCVRIKAIEVLEDSANTSVEIEVSRLVAAAFMGKPPCGYMKIPAHMNGDYTDCSIENLSYVWDDDAEFRMYDGMMRDPGFPLNQSRHRFRVYR